MSWVYLLVTHVSMCFLLPPIRHITGTTKWNIPSTWRIHQQAGWAAEWSVSPMFAGHQILFKEDQNWFGSCWFFLFLMQKEEFHNPLSPFLLSASLRLESSHTCLFHSSLHMLSFITPSSCPPLPSEGGDWELSMWSPSQSLQSWLLSVNHCPGRQALTLSWCAVSYLASLWVSKTWILWWKIAICIVTGW